MRQPTPTMGEEREEYWAKRLRPGVGLVLLPRDIPPHVAYVITSEPQRSGKGVLCCEAVWARDSYTNGPVIENKVVVLGMLDPRNWELVEP